MGRLREVVLLIAVSLLLGNTRAYYDYEGDEDYHDDGDGVPDEDYYGEEEEENYDDDGDDGEDDSGSVEEQGTPPTSGVRNVLIDPSCNNEECSIRVDWEPPQRDTWMSCLLGYKVGFRRTSNEEMKWIYDRSTATHEDMRSDQIFILEEAEETNHSVTIHNLEYHTEYEIQIWVFNPHGERRGYQEYFSTPRGFEFSLFL